MSEAYHFGPTRTTGILILASSETGAQIGFHLGISSWGGKLTDHVAVRPRGEGSIHIIIIGNVLGGGGGS